ncbi:hypothetical protein [Pontibacillus halophilus]|uniref:hypothetical protein n=1 Tax=Pontibacillus halophilus TaxID=516704 RepID=UPI00047C3EB4|nr:hypothetical protein [Pontibacillus halophilus]
MKYKIVSSEELEQRNVKGTTEKIIVHYLTNHSISYRIEEKRVIIRGLIKFVFLTLLFGDKYVIKMQVIDKEVLVEPSEEVITTTIDRLIYRLNNNIH